MLGTEHGPRPQEGPNRLTVECGTSSTCEPLRRLLTTVRMILLHTCISELLVDTLDPTPHLQKPSHLLW